MGILLLRCVDTEPRSVRSRSRRPLFAWSSATRSPPDLPRRGASKSATLASNLLLIAIVIGAALDVDWGTVRLVRGSRIKHGTEPTDSINCKQRMSLKAKRIMILSTLAEPAIALQ